MSKIIIKVEGGNVVGVFTNIQDDVDVDILDLDNYNDEGEEETYREEVERMQDEVEQMRQLY